MRFWGARALGDRMGPHGLLDAKPVQGPAGKTPMLCAEGRGVVWNTVYLPFLGINRQKREMRPTHVLM